MAHTHAAAEKHNKMREEIVMFSLQSRIVDIQVEGNLRSIGGGA
jgi:hypothetical protein